MNLNNRRIRFRDGSYVSSLHAGLTRSLAALAVAACLAVPGFADDTMFHKVYPLTAGGNFQLDNVNGSVQMCIRDRM